MILIGLSVGLFFGCTKKDDSYPNGNKPKANSEDMLVESVKGGTQDPASPPQNRGDVDESPRFGKRENFRVFTKTYPNGLRFYVGHYTQTKEVGGVADPQRPSGPDNRKFETTEGVSVFAMNKKGQVIVRTKLPEKVQRLHEHLETHRGFQQGGTVTPFKEEGFADRFIAFAKSEFDLTVKKGLTDQ